MAYNNGFPVNYQPMYYPQYTQPTQPQNVPQQSNIIWVSGEAGAKSYLVAPNTTVQLWDSEAQSIYLKSADASGMPSMKVLDYTIRESAKPAQPNVVEPAPQYVTKEELDAFEKRIRDQIANIKKEGKVNGKPTV